MFRFIRLIMRVLGKKRPARLEGASAFIWSAAASTRLLVRDRDGRLLDRSEIGQSGAERQVMLLAAVTWPWLVPTVVDDATRSELDRTWGLWTTREPGGLERWAAGDRDMRALGLYLGAVGMVWEVAHYGDCTWTARTPGSVRSMVRGGLPPVTGCILYTLGGGAPFTESRPV